MNAQKAINKLHDLGYVLYLEGENIRYQCTAQTAPKQDLVVSLLNKLKENKREAVIQLKASQRPYLLPCGTLVIPFDSDPKYHWWKGGQSVKQTRKELQAIEGLKNDYQ